MVAVDQKMSFSFDLMALVFIRFQYFIIGDLRQSNKIETRIYSLYNMFLFHRSGDARLY